MAVFCLSEIEGCLATVQINCSANAGLSGSTLSSIALEKSIKGMQPMSAVFGGTADNWIKAIHDISLNLPRSMLIFLVAGSTAAMLMMTKPVSFVPWQP